MLNRKTRYLQIALNSTLENAAGIINQRGSQNINNFKEIFFLLKLKTIRLITNNAKAIIKN